MSRMLYLLFSFDGRIGRLSYGLGTLAQFILVALGCTALVLAFVLGSNAGPIDEQAVTLWAAPISIFSVWSTLALSIKRFHDRDLSGAWVLVALIPVAGTLWWLVQMFVMVGTPGENRYGLPPVMGEIDTDDEDGDLDRRIAGVSVRARRYAGVPDIVRDAKVGARPPIQPAGRPQGFGRRGAQGSR